MALATGWPAPAKLNLFLHVVGRRADGYHLLQTLFRFVDHGDCSRFSPARRRSGGAGNVLAGVPLENDLISATRAAAAVRGE